MADMNRKVMPMDQSETNKSLQSPLDHLIRQIIGKDTFPYSRANENPVQWVQWLESLDQRNGSFTSKGSRSKARQKENVGYNSSNNYTTVKESVQCGVKGTSVLGKSSQSPAQSMHHLRIPETVLAFAQATAKANGEKEKYLPGWPLLSPRAQRFKCEKCNQEFCSSLNYRRHTRMHRRPLNTEKEDLRKERSNIAAFWDKIPVDMAKQILSIDNKMFKDVSGISIVRALSSILQQAHITTLPQCYLKAGSSLLDIAQMKSATFPVAAKDLFSILDDASERTFLCAGISISMQRLLFDGETGSLGLEVRNLIASLAYMVEQELIKAWIADKDAEALRCQKELVEEEEADQKKKAELLEKRRLKKLRQKEKERKAGKPGSITSKGFVDGEAIGSYLTEANHPFSTLECNDPSHGLSKQNHAFDASNLKVQETEANHKMSYNCQEENLHTCESGNMNDVSLVTESVESTIKSQEYHSLQDMHCNSELRDSTLNPAEATNIQRGYEDNRTEQNRKECLPSSNNFVKHQRGRNKIYAEYPTYFPEHHYTYNISLDSDICSNTEVKKMFGDTVSERGSSEVHDCSGAVTREICDVCEDPTCDQLKESRGDDYTMQTEKAEETSLKGSSTVGDPYVETKIAHSKPVTNLGEDTHEPSVCLDKTASLALFVSNYLSSILNNGERAVAGINKSEEGSGPTNLEQTDEHTNQSFPTEVLIGSMSVSINGYMNVSQSTPPGETEIRANGTDKDHSAFRCRSENGVAATNQSVTQDQNCIKSSSFKAIKEDSRDVPNHVYEASAYQVFNVAMEKHEKPLSKKGSGERRETSAFMHTRNGEISNQPEPEKSFTHAAALFLSQRWKDAMEDTKSIIFPIRHDVAVDKSVSHHKGCEG